jgi:hypothetical protein
MVVWGGGTSESTALNTGGRYRVATNSWSATSMTFAPAGANLSTAVWTGSLMIVWGGEVSGRSVLGGSRYNPATNQWLGIAWWNDEVSMGHTAIWTGSRMIVWGGQNNNWVYRSHGGLYDPVADTWTSVSTGPNVPNPRRDHSAVWTGTEMIIWGGYAIGSSLGARYDPAADSWTPVSTANAPPVRGEHTALWTGTHMVVWGGRDGFSGMDTGGRYAPTTNLWAPTTSVDVPPGRYGHNAVWTGDQARRRGRTAFAATTRIWTLAARASTTARS